MKQDEFVARIGVGHMAGPSSAILRVWSPATKSDVYAAIRERAGDIKVSLHESGECNAGLTEQFANREAAAVAAMGGLRHQNRWIRRTHVGSATETPLQFALPASELRVWRTQPIAGPGITWIAAPRANRSIIVSCVFSGQKIANDEWPGRRDGTQLLGTKLLPNGEKFWLIWQDCPTSVYERSMISEALELRASPDMIRFTGVTDDTPLPPRVLIFKEFPFDRLLVVLDASAD